VDKACSKDSLKEQSPFTAFFSKSIANISVAEESIYPPNPLYSTKGFSAVRDVVHLYPLWAAALHYNVTRFSKNETSGNEEISQPRSNAAVESRFRYRLCQNVKTTVTAIGDLFASVRRLRNGHK
jgi:hypothetical protein